MGEPIWKGALVRILGRTGQPFAAEIVIGGDGAPHIVERIGEFDTREVNADMVTGASLLAAFADLRARTSVTKQVHTPEEHLELDRLETERREARLNCPG